MTAAQRREAVTWLMTTRHVSERLARRLSRSSASSFRYASQRGVADRPVRQGLHALAEQRPRWGSPRLHWSMDFVRDALADGRPFRAFTVVDDFTRECPVIAVDTHLSSERVIAVLEQLAGRRGLPKALVGDNGSEFTRRAFDAWAYRRGIKLLFIRPAKPVGNAFIESVNGKLRDECLSTSWFLDLADARAQIEDWRHDYNTARPHSGLAHRTPSHFARNFTRVAPSTDP